MHARRSHARRSLSGGRPGRNRDERE